mmetsp:Transcript_26733/g.49070  ORF Transcript_26733/g.49070 Transcript_26733/m.49070 type:complete len:305 (+) Transcript_26733:82-996(+)
MMGFVAHNMPSQMEPMRIEPLDLRGSPDFGGLGIGRAEPSLHKLLDRVEVAERREELAMNRLRAAEAQMQFQSMALDTKEKQIRALQEELAAAHARTQDDEEMLITLRGELQESKLRVRDLEAVSSPTLLASMSATVPGRFPRPSTHLAASCGPIVVDAFGEKVVKDGDCVAVALLRAAGKGNSAECQRMLHARADPNVGDSMSFQALHGAAKSGSLESVRLLVSARASVNARVEGWQKETPLHYACKYGHTEVVKYLVDNGADPEVRTKDGKSPADHASSKGHTKVLDELGARVAAIQSPSLE